MRSSRPPTSGTAKKSAPTRTRSLSNSASASNLIKGKHMPRQHTRLISALAAATLGALLLGCADSKDGTSPTAGLFPPPPDKSGSQLWAENCSRCHNIRPPQQYSDAQWSMIVQHMRMRADLTGQE